MTIISNDEKSRALPAIAVAASLLIIFSLLRLYCSFGSLWFDEISSIGFANQLNSASEALTLIRHDNNHILNTVYLYMVGKDGGAVSYRLFSVLTGSVSLALLYFIGRRRGAVEALVALFLGGLSFPLIVYSSEARGYAPAIMFALFSFIFITEGRQKKTAYLFALFWVSTILGFLSHLSFIYIYLALGVWSVYPVISKKKKDGTLELIKWHAVPIALLFSLYLINTRHLVIGGGHHYSLSAVVIRAASAAVGAPDYGIWIIPGMIAAIAIFAGGLISVKKSESNETRGEWIFFLCAIIVAPALILIVRRPEVLYFRYFIICFPFFYLLMAHLLAGIFSKNKTAFTVILILFSILNLCHIYSFLRSERGDYLSATLHMAENTKVNEIYVASNHDLQVRTGLAYLLPKLPEGKRMIYLTYSDWKDRPEFAPDWFIYVSPYSRYSPLTVLSFKNGVSYGISKNFGFYGPSGATWTVYKKSRPIK
ncbi:MAG: glycosyltransferase family 39 protein [Thermodesulfobacteriota bacterium]